MYIRNDRTYNNKTVKYLVPLLRTFGNGFVSKINELNKMAITIGHEEVDEIPSIHVLVDPSYNIRAYESFVDYIRDKPYYSRMYIHEKGYVFVFTLEEKWRNAYECFLRGEYSKMYTTEEINIFFSSSNRISAYEILTKNPKIKQDFIKKVNEEFGTELKEEDFYEPLKELELPPRYSEELLNSNNLNFIKTIQDEQCNS